MNDKIIEAINIIKRQIDIDLETDNVDSISLSSWLILEELIEFHENKKRDEDIRKFSKLCRRNLKSKRIKCCKNCPFKEDIIKACPDLEELFKESKCG